VDFLKHNGTFPIIGVNTFLSKEGSPTVIPGEVIRATKAEKESQIATLENLHQSHDGIAKNSLSQLKRAAVEGKNTFEALMEAGKYCSMGQITHAMFDVGGQYRRNM